MDLGTYFLISTAERENHREAREKRETVPPIKATSGCINEYAVAPRIYQIVECHWMQYSMNNVRHFRISTLYQYVIVSDSFLRSADKIIYFSHKNSTALNQWRWIGAHTHLLEAKNKIGDLELVIWR